MKRLLALFLCLLMCLSLIPAATAEDVDINIAQTIPVIDTHPKSLCVSVGSTAKFTVSVTGIDLGYQWQYRTGSSDTWKDSTVSSAKTAALSINAESHRNGYQYRVKVFNSSGTTISNAATLTILSKPSVKSHPKSIDVTLGSTAKFTVSASGGALSYQWQYRTSSSGTWANSEASGAKTATLSIKAENHRNGYQYRCKVTNILGSITSNAATLSILSKPSITTQPKSVCASPGSTAKFTISAAGGALSYQWQYRTGASGSWANSGAAGAKTAVLSISAEAHRNNYQYRCKVTNAAGTTYSSAATLTVASKPVITTQPKSVSSTAGNTAKFTVSATGSSLNYQWQYRTSSSGTWTNSEASGAQTTTLSIKVESHRNGYQYRCRVSNGVGTAYSNPATLTVTGPVIVYWVPNGSVYHSSTSCRSLARSKEILSGTIEEALALGYDAPCKNCW